MINESAVWESVEWLNVSVVGWCVTYIPETVFLNHQGFSLGMVLTSAPSKNAALSHETLATENRL
jgi:hypothetical protein